MQSTVFHKYWSNSVAGIRCGIVAFRCLVPNITICALSFIIGVCATLLFNNLIALPILFTLAFCLILIVTRYIIVLPILLMLLGFNWATLIFTDNYNQQLPSQHEGQTIVVTGQIQGLPDNKPQSSRFSFLISDAIAESSEKIPELIKQTVVLSCYHCNLTFEPDQRWTLSVRLKRPHSYASWGAFDYEKYLFRQQVIATGYIRLKDPYERLPEAVDFSANQWRYQISNSLQQHLQHNQVARAIIAALMIGEKSQFSQKQQLVFQKTGISHLMAISGLHIGLAFLVTSWLLKWMLAPVAQLFYWIPRQKLVLIPALFVAFSYAALAGFAISTQRAMIMLSLFVFARFLARDLSLLKVLMITVVIILIYDPLSVLDVGFWLSCSAVLVIGLIAEYQKNKKIVSDTIEGAEIEKLSLVKLQPLLWFGMLPVTLLFFGKISILSPVVNLLMVPLFCGALIPLTLFSLVLQLLGLTFISNSLLSGLGYFYKKIYLVLDWLAELPIAQMSLPPMRVVDWLLFIVVAVAYYMSWRIRHVLVILFVVVFVGLNNTRNLAPYEYNVTLLDVGQGLAMVVEAPDYVLVYDTGPAYASGFSAAEAVLIPYLEYRGIRQIDMLVISHADNDHIGGLSRLQDAFEIEQILSSRVDKIPSATNCQTGQTWAVANIHFEILSPDQQTPQGSNNRSCVLMISNGYKSVLLSGDIEQQVERYLLNSDAKIKADVLLVPHQGSKTSSTVKFIEAVEPVLGLIAAGYRNHYGHPHHDVVDRYKERNIAIASTIESGSIFLNINENIIEMRSYRQSNKGFWNHIKKPT